MRRKRDIRGSDRLQIKWEGWKDANQRKSLQQIYEAHWSLPNGVQQNIYEKGVTLSGYVSFCKKNLVVASLHQVLEWQEKKQFLLPWAIMDTVLLCYSSSTTGKNLHSILDLEAVFTHWTKSVRKVMSKYFTLLTNSAWRCARKNIFLQKMGI